MQNNDPNTPAGGGGRPQQPWPGQGAPQGQPPQGRPPQGQPPQPGQPGRPPQQPYGQPPQYAQQPPQQSQQPQQRAWPQESAASTPTTSGQGEQKSSKLAVVATVVAILGALAAIVYGAFAAVMRRGVFADIAEDSSSVSQDDASSSDRLDQYMMYGALALVVIAVLLWLAATVSARRGRSGLGYTGFALVVVGAIGAGVGAYLTTSDDVDTIANGYLAVGAGFVLVGVGLLLGAVALRQADDGADDEPYRYQPAANPYAEQRPNPYAQQPPQQYGQPPQGGQPYGRPPQQGGPPYGQPPQGDQNNPYGGQGR